MTIEQKRTASAPRIHDPYVAFMRDVPEALRDDAMQMMSEATGQCCEHACVAIIDHERLDATNHRASGVIEIEGREYAFEMLDGDDQGTVLVSWNEDRPFVRSEPVIHTLQPTADLIEQAMRMGRGALLLVKWDAMLSRPEVARIATSYAYDRHFAPGVITDAHWTGAARTLGLVIVDAETAEATRRRLAA